MKRLHFANCRSPGLLWIGHSVNVVVVDLASCRCNAFVLTCVPLTLHRSDNVLAFKYSLTQLSCVTSVGFKPDLQMSSISKWGGNKIWFLGIYFKVRSF